MPLTRQASFGSTSSTNRRYSLPNTIDSSTHVTKEKAEAMMNRRKTRRQSLRERDTKANSNENVLQSPTPYWKVAKERGMSPPETRSAKKVARSTKLNFTSPDKENTR